MNPTFTGIVEDMPIEEYHAHPHLSNSGISALMRSPAHYRQKDLKDSKALRIGTMLHTLILEPHIAARWEPKASLRLKSQRDERQTAEDCAAAIIENPLVQGLGLLDKARAKHELSMFTEVKTDEGPCFMRARFDIWMPELGTAFDPKTTEDAGRKAFLRSVEQFGYFRQAALYMRVARTLGLEVNDDGFVFIAVEKSAPFGVKLYALDDQAIEQGDREVMRAAEIWARCHRLGAWPSYEDKIDTLCLSPWMIDAEEN